MHYGLIISILTIILYYNFFYYHELNAIKSELQENESIEIVRVWGNEDITFEDVYAILKVKNKGNLSIYNLSSDVNNFPEEVFIGEIGLYTFTLIDCKNGFSSWLNIGIKSDFGKKTGIKFNKVEDVINHYDEIIKYVETYKNFPKYNYYETEKCKEAILFIDKNRMMNSENLMKYYNSESIFDLRNEVYKTRKKKE